MKVLLYLTFSAVVAVSFSSCTTPDSELSGAKKYIATGLQGVLTEEYSRGEERMAALKEIAEDKTQRDLQSKAKRIYFAVKDMDEDAITVIEFIENAKLQLFYALGKPKSELIKSGILVRPYSTKDPLYASSYDLNKLELSAATDLLDPDGKFSTELKAHFENFRRSISEGIAASVLVEDDWPPYYFKDPMIGEYSSVKDLAQQVDTAIARSHVAQDDSETLKRIYMLLSHNSKSWNQLLIDDLYWVDAFTILLQLEKDILTARADMVSLIRSRIGCGGCYGFDKIMSLANGPEVARVGEEVYIEVLMAAFDENKQPFVTATNAEVVEVKNGKARVKVKINKPGELEVHGTITINNKSGIPKTVEWRKRIVVLD